MLSPRSPPLSRWDPTQQQQQQQAAREEEEERKDAERTDDRRSDKNDNSVTGTSLTHTGASTTDGYEFNDQGDRNGEYDGDTATIVADESDEPLQPLDADGGGSDGTSSGTSKKTRTSVVYRRVSVEQSLQLASLLQQMYEQMEKRGTEHPLTLITYSELATIYFDTKTWKEAEVRAALNAVDYLSTKGGEWTLQASLEPS